MNNGFFVAKVITWTKSKGVYVGDMIKKRRYWPKVVSGNLMDTHFEDKEFGDVGMLEKKTKINSFLEYSV